MDSLIDFNDCRTFLNDYEGADTKLKISLENEIYMLKLGRKLDDNERNLSIQASYSSSPVSEYIGCHAFFLAGIPVQETKLGTYNGHIVVACKDFIQQRSDSEDVSLIEFNKLQSSFLQGKSPAGRTPALDNVLHIFTEHPYLNSIRDQATDRFWKTFAVDSIVGNFDRHAGNWGYIYNNSIDRIIDLAPVYDCGSSFYPKLNEHGMLEFVRNPDLLKQRVLVFPTAALMVNGKKAKYHEFLLSEEGKPARRALLDISKTFDMSKFLQFIAEMPGLTELQREFYSTLVTVRNETIIDPALDLAWQEEMAKSKDGIGIDALMEQLAEPIENRFNAPDINKDNWDR